MIWLLLIGLALVAVSARLVIHAAVLPRIKLAVHLREIDAYGFEGMAPAGGAPARQSLSAALSALAERVGGITLRTLPALPALKRRDLTAAALYEISPETMHGYRILAAVFLPATMLFCAALGGGADAVTMLLALAAGGAGWYMPAMAIRARGQRRINQVDRDLPDLIDLLTATMEAGMGFAASLDLVAGRFKGALGEELRLTQQQQKLGVSNDQALKDMVERCDTGSMRSFVRTLRTAESLGVSIGASMRELAHDVRRRRRQTAEERMRKAPVKLLFPLIFLIFPTLLIEVLYPAAYTLIHNLGAVGS
ncbi:MAG: type II secretion system F family protein [Solirubrobacteraceae bacterium]